MNKILASLKTAYSDIAIAKMMATYHLIFPFELLLRFYFYSKTNRIPEKFLSIEMFLDIGLCVFTAIWYSHEFHYNTYREDIGLYNLADDITLLKEDQLFMLSVITVMLNPSELAEKNEDYRLGTL